MLEGTCGIRKRRKRVGTGSSYLLQRAYGASTLLPARRPPKSGSGQGSPILCPICECVQSQVHLRFEIEQAEQFPDGGKRSEATMDGHREDEQALGCQGGDSGVVELIAPPPPFVYRVSVECRKIGR